NGHRHQATLRILITLDKNWHDSTSDARKNTLGYGCHIQVARRASRRTARDDRCSEVPVSFLLACPNCGPRDVYEFRFGGEFGTRPQPGASGDMWSRYLYVKTNEAGVQKEWWYHRGGCHAW